MRPPKIALITRTLWRIKPREKIARVPRMLAVEYDDYTELEGRVMNRYGIRSPSGLKRAMRAHGVNNIEDLIAALEHHRPRRRFWRRVYLMFQRAVGGTPYPPHVREIRQAFRAREINPEIAKRLKQFKEVK